MKILNIHQREYRQSSSVISEILDTLSSGGDDRVWPWEIWPPMILDNGLRVNSSGGHGPIGYYVSNYEYGTSVEFTFTQPEGYSGTHTFEIIECTDRITLLRHTINMNLSLKGVISWYCAVRWLHDALLTDCLNKIGNQLNEEMIQSPHGFWVRVLRNILKRKRKSKRSHIQNASFF